MSWNRKHTDQEIIAAVEKHGGLNAAARALDIDRRNLTRRFRKAAPYKQRMAADASRTDVDPGVVEAASETGLSLDTARHGWRRIQREDGGFDSVFWRNQEDEAQESAAASGMGYSGRTTMKAISVNRTEGEKNRHTASVTLPLK